MKGWDVRGDIEGDERGGREREGGQEDDRRERRIGQV